MPTEENILKELDDLSSQVSSQSRAINIGVLIIIWGLIFTNIDSLKQNVDAYYKLLLFTGGISVIAMLLDFIQYLIGYSHVKSHQQEHGDSKDKTVAI